MAQSIRRKYYAWLIDIVCSEEQKRDYSALLASLHSREFTWFVYNDDNRMVDGINLRYEYCESIGVNYDDNEFDFNCTVLEMMVALAKRCKETIIGDYDSFDASTLFWKMIENLGLIDQTDNNFDGYGVDDSLNIMLNRQYASDGSGGGLFVVENPRKDLRKVEIWYQMNWYLNTIMEEIY